MPILVPASAEVKTASLYESAGTPSPPQICWPSGEARCIAVLSLGRAVSRCPSQVYGSIAKEDPVPNKRYTSGSEPYRRSPKVMACHGICIWDLLRLRDKAGQRIFTYNGNFQEKAKGQRAGDGDAVTQLQLADVLVEIVTRLRISDTIVPRALVRFEWFVAIIKMRSRLLAQMIGPLTKTSSGIAQGDVSWPLQKDKSWWLPNKCRRSAKQIQWPGSQAKPCPI